MKQFHAAFYLAICTFVFFSCKKYAEGPFISFRSRGERVSNTWQPEIVLKNGNNITSSYQTIGYTETYTKDGTYSYSSDVGSGSGKWAFQANDTQIKRHGVSGQSTVEMTILKLKEKDFWFSYTDGGDNYEFRMVPK